MAAPDQNRYHLYLRSMSVYDDHHCQDLEYSPKLNILSCIKSFNTFAEAVRAMMDCGLKMTQKFEKKYEQGCAFVILEDDRRPLGSLLDLDRLDESASEDTGDVFDLYHMYFDIPHFVFTHESYHMCLNENEIYASHDWNSPFPAWLFYVVSLDDHETYQLIRGATAQRTLEMAIRQSYFEEHIVRNVAHALGYEESNKEHMTLQKVTRQIVANGPEYDDPVYALLKDKTSTLLTQAQKMYEKTAKKTTTKKVTKAKNQDYAKKVRKGKSKSSSSKSSPKSSSSKSSSKSSSESS